MNWMIIIGVLTLAALGLAMEIATQADSGGNARTHFRIVRKSLFAIVPLLLITGVFYFIFAGS
ncbi:hypothetical protein [Alkalicoccus daliensis]|uniref:Uncharacterized protein n=1 Tax=Alkalicoccus daliensis TaxID=745820 RepID=A0A1H0D574_9BACI|nr:hypothetical protein [Alkalicoccus daliensis]SDN65312.1 hypothetical protein SAMN04488053_102348 [Alkalicoccus daliensis]